MSQIPGGGESEAQSSEGRTLPPRYGALRTIGGVYRVLGWVVIIGGILISLLAAAGVAARGDDGGAGVVGLATFVGGTIWSLVTGLLLLAFADLVALLIDIEQNTRATALNVAEMD